MNKEFLLNEVEMDRENAFAIDDMETAPASAGFFFFFYFSA